MQQDLFGDPQPEAHRARHELNQHVHPQMLVAAGYDRGTEERHPDHDEDLHFIGCEKRDAKQIAPHHVGEVQNHGHDESDRKSELDGPRNAVERLVDHRTLPPSFQHCPARAAIMPSINPLEQPPQMH